MFGALLSCMSVLSSPTIPPDIREGCNSIFRNCDIDAKFFHQNGVSLWHLSSLPSAEVADSYCKMAAEHRDWIDKRRQHWLSSEDKEYWEMRYQDQMWRVDVWRDLSLVHYNSSDNYGIEYTLNRLLDLRTKIGDDFYYNGVMPCPVAIWYYELR